MTNLERELNRLHNVFVKNGEKQRFSGDAFYDNICYEEAKKFGCLFPVADNYDWKSTKDGITKVLNYLMFQLMKEKKND